MLYNALSVPRKTSSIIASKIICCYNNILVHKKSSYNTTLADKEINNVRQLFDTNSALKPWREFRREFSLSKNSHFCWIKSNITIETFERKPL